MEQVLLDQIIALRAQLHACAEVSGREAVTKHTLLTFLRWSFMSLRAASTPRTVSRRAQSPQSRCARITTLWQRPRAARRTCAVTTDMPRRCAASR